MWPPRVISHQLRSPDNLGSIARLMANFGLASLTLSDPVTHDFRGAERLGVGAESILSSFQIAATLEEALAPVVYAVGSTSRTQLKRHTPLTPEEGIARLKAHASRGPVALVLGGEKRGLSDAELALVQDVIVIPTPGPHPSMNVSQAAGVLFYLCARAGLEAVPQEAPGARLGTVAALEKKLEGLLGRAEFLNPQAPEHALKELTRALVRGRLSQREVELWLAACTHLDRHLR
jgi:tRNA/rRNA methyltransferase